MKNLLICLLCLCLLCGCGRDAPAQSAEGEKETYAAQFTMLDYVNGIHGACVAGGRVYYATDKSGTSVQTIYSCAADGSDPRELEGYADFGAKAWADAQSPASYRMYDLIASPNGTLYSIAIRDAGQADDGVTVALQLDSEGTVTGQRAFADIIQMDWLQRSPMADDAGNLYFVGESYVRVFGPDGAERGRLIPPVGAEPRNLLHLADGTPALITTDAVYRIVPDTAALERICLFDRPSSSDVYLDTAYFSGVEGYDLVASTGMSLLGYKLEEGGETAPAPVELLNWLNCNVDGNGLLGLGTAGEELLCVTFSEAFGLGASRLEKVVVAPGEQTVLTLACRGVSQSVAQQVLRFNRSSPDCRVEIRNYGSMDLTGAVDALTAEMLSGQMPDLFCTEAMPVEDLAAQGVLEDLWPYIDGDAQLGGREALVTSVFEAMAVDGKLYEIAPGFAVSTMIGPTRLVGEAQGWTWEEFWSIYEAAGQPIVCDYPSARSVRYSTLLPVYLPGLLQSGDFRGADFQNFIRLAEACTEERATTHYTMKTSTAQLMGMLADRDMLLHREGMMRGPNDLLTAKMYFGGEEATAIGFPGLAGSGAVAQIDTPMAMTTGCKDKEAAWQFLRAFLLPENQTFAQNYNELAHDCFFPTSMRAYASMMQGHMTIQVDENGEPIRAMQVGVGSYGIQLAAWTQEMADELWDLIAGIRTVERRNFQLEIIIQDEAERLFTGSQSLETTLNNTQGRVDLYRGERDQ